MARSRYPLNNAQLIGTFRANSTSYSGPQIVGILTDIQGYTPQQIREQLGTAGLTPAQIRGLMTAKGPTGLQKWLGQIKVIPIPLEPIPPAEDIPGTPRAGGGAAGAAGGAGAATAGRSFVKTAESITTAVAFLQLAAWMVHPRNILRAVEFLTGIVLMIFGLHATLQARGERLEGFTTSEGVITRSGLGRVATELGRAARTGSRPSRPRSAPHRTRQRALQQRYAREEDLQRRRAKAPRPKKP